MAMESDGRVFGNCKKNEQKRKLCVNVMISQKPPDALKRSYPVVSIHTFPKMTLNCYNLLKR